MGYVAEDSTTERSNIKCDRETFYRLLELKSDGETWDGLLERAADALDADEPLREFSDAKVYTKPESLGNHEGRVEIYPNWVRLVGGAMPTWVPRDEIEQIHES